MLFFLFAHTYSTVIVSNHPEGTVKEKRRARCREQTRSWFLWIVFERGVVCVSSPPFDVKAASLLV